MKILARLKREAKACAEFRGHKMKRFNNSNYWPNTAWSECNNCGAIVAVNTNPPPNGIDIGGDALAISCTQRGNP